VITFRVLKLTSQVATAGAESAVYDCLVFVRTLCVPSPVSPAPPPPTDATANEVTCKIIFERVIFLTHMRSSVNRRDMKLR